MKKRNYVFCNCCDRQIEIGEISYSVVTKNVVYYCNNCMAKFVLTQEDIDTDIESFCKNNDEDCPLGGDIENDCADCVYSCDYHYVNGGCIERGEL